MGAAVATGAVAALARASDRAPGRRKRRARGKEARRIEPWRVRCDMGRPRRCSAGDPDSRPVPTAGGCPVRAGSSPASLLLRQLRGPRRLRALLPPLAGGARASTGSPWGFVAGLLPANERPRPARGRPRRRRPRPPGIHPPRRLRRGVPLRGGAGRRRRGRRPLVRDRLRRRPLLRRLPLAPGDARRPWWPSSAPPPPAPPTRDPPVGLGGLPRRRILRRALPRPGRPACRSPATNRRPAPGGALRRPPLPARPSGARLPVAPEARALLAAPAFAVFLAVAVLGQLAHAPTTSASRSTCAIWAPPP